MTGMALTNKFNIDSYWQHITPLCMHLHAWRLKKANIRFVLRNSLLTFFVFVVIFDAAFPTLQQINYWALLETFIPFEGDPVAIVSTNRGPLDRPLWTPWVPVPARYKEWLPLSSSSNRQAIHGVPGTTNSSVGGSFSGGTWLFDCGECTQVRLSCPGNRKLQRRKIWCWHQSERNFLDGDTHLTIIDTILLMHRAIWVVCGLDSS
jgi:hypothetical protein